jgi:hypothetical protein
MEKGKEEQKKRKEKRDGMRRMIGLVTDRM